MDSLRLARILLPLAIAVFVLLSGCLNSVSSGEDPVSVNTPTPVATSNQGTPGVTRDEVLCSANPLILQRLASIFSLGYKPLSER